MRVVETIDPLASLASAVDRGARGLDVAEDAAIVLAVSGGSDSMALLIGSAQLVATGTRRWQLTVAHLDHCLRPDSGEDAIFVADAAARLDLPVEVRRTDVAALASAEGRSLEEAGREARYRFLEEVAPSGALIATAHTLDDLAETVLLNLLRGTGSAGMAGMPARRGRIVRPLLGERRAALRAMLDAAAIDYRDDPSNADPAFLRNRVRGELLPLLESLRDGAVERIGRFAGLAAADDSLLDRVAAVELGRRRTDDGAIDWHDPPPVALGRRVLRIAIGEPPPSAERIQALLEAAAGSRGGVTIELGGGRSASVKKRVIVLQDTK